MATLTPEQLQANTTANNLANPLYSMGAQPTTPVAPMAPVTPTLPPANTISSGFSIDTTKATTRDTSTPTNKTDTINYAQRLQDSLSAYNKSRDALIGGTDFAGYDNNINTGRASLLGAQQADRSAQLSETGALLGLGEVGETKGFATGQQGLLQRQQALTQQSRSLDILAKSENLQALTGIKQTALDTLKTKLGFEDTRLEKLLGVESALQGLDKQAKEEARLTITEMLNFSKGKSFNELDPESQQELIKATAKSPYTLGQVQQSLERNKVAAQDDRAKAAKDNFMSVGDKSRIFNTATGKFVGGGGSGGSGGSGGGGLGGGGGTASVGGKVANISSLNQIATQLASKITTKFQQESFYAAVKQFKARGDDQGLAYYLRTTAADQIPTATVRQKYTQNIEILKGLDRISIAMDAAEAAGIDTNMFSGSAQSIRNKVGELGSPELVDIAQQVLNARDLMTRDRTGAALSNNEEKFYKKMFPSIFNKAELNKQILSNLRTSIQSSTDSYLGLGLSDSQQGTVKRIESGVAPRTGTTSSGIKFTIE